MNECWGTDPDFGISAVCIKFDSNQLGIGDSVVLNRYIIEAQAILQNVYTPDKH